MRTQFPWLLAATLFIVGCHADLPPGIPDSAAKVVELVAPSGSRSTTPAKLQSESGGALYVYDASRKTILYSGAVGAAQVIYIYESGVAVAATLPSRSVLKSIYEHRVATFDPGVKYAIYFDAGGKPVAPTSDAGSPLTQPYQERSRTVDQKR